MREVRHGMDSVIPLEIAVYGLNHRSAPVAMLEKLAYSPESRLQHSRH